MEHLITDYVLQYGYLAVFVLMVLESACIPVPSEVTMLFGGALANGAFLASLGQQGEHLNFVVVALVGAFGNLVGSWIAWGVGYRGGRPLIERWGRYVFLREHELDVVERYMRPVSYTVAAVCLVAIAWWFYRRWSDSARSPGRHERAATKAKDAGADTDPEGRTAARRP